MILEIDILSKPLIDFLDVLNITRQNSIDSDVKGLDISVEEDCLPDSDFCQGSLTCGDKGICYYPHLIRNKCCMTQ